MQQKAPIPRSILSLDIGKKRIGLAGCDALGITIKRLPAIHRKKFTQDLHSIKECCRNRNVEGLVFGLPLDEKGLPTKQSEICQHYGERLAIELQLPIAWVNEHSTSWLASEVLNLRNDRSGRVDSEAAALILEQWLREGPDLKPIKKDVTTIN